MKRITNYLSASFVELKKVIWPTRKVALQLTVAVIIGALLVGMYLTLLGFGFQSILRNLLFKN